MRPRIWILITALLAALPIADAILWHIAVGWLEAGFDAWTARGRAAGWTVTPGRTVSGGWPWAATLTIAGVSVSGGGPAFPGGLAWQTPELVLRVPLVRPRSLDIEAKGEQKLRLANVPAVLTGTRLLVVASLSAEEDAQDLDILADQPRLAMADTSPARWSLAARELHAHIQLAPESRPAEAPAASFALSADSVALPASIRWPLGATIASIAIEGAVEGPVPPSQPPIPWANAWRDGGGVVQFQHVQLTWGPLILSASATLALDDQLQPMGAGTSKLTGYAATLDALAGNGALSRSAAIAAKAVLSLLAGSPADGDPADVEVPLTLQYRTLSIRQIPLWRLPELDWPGQ